MEAANLQLALQHQAVHHRPGVSLPADVGALRHRRQTRSPGQDAAAGEQRERLNPNPSKSNPPSSPYQRLNRAWSSAPSLSVSSYVPTLSSDPREREQSSVQCPPPPLPERRSSRPCCTWTISFDAPINRLFCLFFYLADLLLYQFYPHHDQLVLELVLGHSPSLVPMIPFSCSALCLEKKVKKTVGKRRRAFQNVAHFKIRPADYSSLDSIS